MVLDDVMTDWQRLSNKIAGALLGFLFLALVAIGATLLLSWQLQGSSAAINESGSLRMHSYRLTLLLARWVADGDLARGHRSTAVQELAVIDATFEVLKQGNPQRPLYLPPAAGIRLDFQRLATRWRQEMRPLAQTILKSSAAPAMRRESMQAYESQVDNFVNEINNLVSQIESDSEQRASWLRSSQLALMALAMVGTVALLYLFFLLIIRPVTRLQEGMARMTGQDFGVRLQVESRDEFGILTEGFNQMADRLEGLYANLESLVQQKTAELERQNRELALLYDCAAFLQQPQNVAGLCDGFLQRISQYFLADGGSVRVLDARRGNLHMVVHHGISDELVEAEHCLKVGDCLCGAAVAQKLTVVHDLRSMDSEFELQCHKDGFNTVSVFHIYSHQQHLGFFNLHFRAPKTFSKGQLALLDTLGQLLGVAIQNIRLATREREMAISEERNLVAQGLHDSIAQGLTFMNIQVQMLEESLQKRKFDEIAEIAPALRAGVRESYEDVRELLLNFRSRLAEGDLVRSLETTLDKFRRQTGIQTELVADSDGAPLPCEQQLQVLFIVQEALSNIRKHALATQVEIRLMDRHDFTLSIRDDGVGCDAETVRGKGESHVGINIMRERAQRISASFEFQSAPSAGTTVTLKLGREQRRAA